MRKQILSHTTLPQGSPQPSRWLDLERVAQVELTSEDEFHPIESALRPDGSPGWRAALPGPQTIRLIFDAPQRVRQIYLEFVEQEMARTQEFVLRWSPDQGSTKQEIVRQQFNFSPPGTSVEREEYQVNLTGVTQLELELLPAQGRTEMHATLARLLIS